MKDDDEEEENTFGVQRYPCMPSLVALQQMRNRLHLAFLGKKLMKWSALATGKELRRISAELYEIHKGFREDVQNAFILLARSRYFYPQLNQIVTEGIAEQAAVVVQQSTKQISSVKITKFKIIETEYPPYEYLGLEKGGQSIQEAKKAWLELLKRLIMMIQLRTSFLMVEDAHKSATKKMNVLSKIVIPRTNVTMEYINNTLEEQAREQFFRLKKILDIKRRMYGGKDKDKNKGKDEDKRATICPTCEIDDKNLQSLCPKSCMISEPEFGSDELILDEINKLVEHVHNIVEVTKKNDKREFANTSFEEVIKTAEELKSKLGLTSEPKKEVKFTQLKSDDDDAISLFKDDDSRKTKLPDDIDYDAICETCKEKYEKNQDDDIQTDPITKDRMESHVIKIHSRETTISIQTNPSKQTVVEGYERNVDKEFNNTENEVKKITITKVKNEDGSISMEKEIKIEKQGKDSVRKGRKEGKKPPSQSSSANRSGNVSSQASSSSNKSNPYSRSKTIGAVTVKRSKLNNPLQEKLRQVKSEDFSTFSPLSDPTERFCMSSTTLLFTDLDCNLTASSYNNLPVCLTLNCTNCLSEQSLLDHGANHSSTREKK